MNNIKINSVEEMFRWKLPKKILDQYGLKKEYYKSVEDENRKQADALKWPKELDVLYSFLLVYKRGLLLVNEDRLKAIKKEMEKEWHVKSINTNSTEFLFRCSRDSAYQKFNNCVEIKEFLQLYFSIGNVIPIWPGGNEARGKSGIYDIPEIFFNKYPIWTNVLIEQYETAYLDDVVNETSFKNITDFETQIKKNEHVYFDYLVKRNNVIRMRKKKLLDYLEIRS